ncbi:hypothetical protein QTL95_24045 [Rhizobium sp. S152]|uniref:hypothetical protein n=1 Tax=Rhizobium sp. S152 TaxID=3055038 RepID=UPI0025A9C6F5|nr:hypothetical protein [Rhizobium sp. S152]MDM9628975.1 hypothetical protein [Rhizobium sp. S152]
MLFGQSLFQSVLDRLKADEDELADEDQPAAPRVHGFNTGLAFDVMEGVSVAAARPDRAYVDNLEPDLPEDDTKPGAPPEPEPEPIMPEHLLRLSPQEIAAELAISPSDTIQSLGEKRRLFAKSNHPDSVAVPFRDNATQRMMTANLLIDAAIRRVNR